jgi:hypothetical protein
MIEHGATCLIKDNIKDLEKQLETATADKKAAHKELDEAKVAYQRKKCEKNIKEFNKKNRK